MRQSCKCVQKEVRSLEIDFTNPSGTQKTPQLTQERTVNPFLTKNQIKKLGIKKQPKPKPLLR